MIEVFKTNIDSPEIAISIMKILEKFYPEALLNFDLDDCDNILRINSGNIISDEIVCILNTFGFSCEIL